jgi:hypothetical protein
MIRVVRLARGGDPRHSRRAFAASLMNAVHLNLRTVQMGPSLLRLAPADHHA